ncbi:nose resistant to fluoxetine protein 6-like, partial [Asbolus verrucosus]
MWKIIFWLLCVTSASCDNSEKPQLLSLWRDFPLHAAMNKTILQPQCRKAYQNFLKQVENNDLSALKMLDATAKLPSGILSGNIIQYGDFDECMGVETAQYCLVEMDFDHLWRKPHSKLKDLVHSYYLFREDFSDPAHRLPGFSMARWGFCIPRECSSDDLERSLRENFGVKTQIRPGMCQKSVKDVEPWGFGDYIARIFFAVIIGAVSASTLIDVISAHLYTKILMSFSLSRNLSKLLEVRENSHEIGGLHGIRTLNAIALLLCHKSVSLFFNPYMNRTATIERLTRPWTIIAKNAIIYTDSFILLSALLNANALLTDLTKGQSMQFKKKLLNRIFRVLPNVIALILFCTYIMPSLGSGPLWPTIVDHHSVLCKKYMWRNMFFIHNYFGFENMIAALWGFFLIFTKIAYALYLVQFPVFFYNVGVTKHIAEYKPHFQ